MQRIPGMFLQKSNETEPSRLTRSIRKTLYTDKPTATAGVVSGFLTRATVPQPTPKVIITSE